MQTLAHWDGGPGPWILFFPLIKKFLPKPTPPAAPAPEREKVDA